MSSAAPIAATAVILAAGRGSRMKSRHPKAVHRILGKPLVYYPAELCRALGISRIVVVVPPGGAVQQALGEGFEYVVQPEARGTADALRTAICHLGEAQQPVLVLAASEPALGVAYVRELLARYAEQGTVSALTLGQQYPPVPRFMPCVLNAAALRAALAPPAAEDAAPASEISDLLQVLEAQGHPVHLLPRGVSDDFEVSDRFSLTQAANLIRMRIVLEHLDQGVTIEDPLNTYIEPGVTIGQDTLVRPQSFLSTGTVIGEECEIGPFVRIDNCRLGDRVSVQSAVLADSEVDDDTRIGPFAQLRPGCKVGPKVKIGNFVELKNTTVEERASMGHFAYLGDAFIGEKSNIGAGTITCNYDGKKKHHTHIGRNTFVGTHATLVAPVQVGDGAFIAAGSVVTEEVPADALAIGRARQVNKPGWAKQRRERE